MNKKLITIAILIVMISTGLMAGNWGSNFGGEMERCAVISNPNFRFCID